MVRTVCDPSFSYSLSEARNQLDQLVHKTATNVKIPLEEGPVFGGDVDRLCEALNQPLELRRLSIDPSERRAALLLKLNLTHFKLVIDRKRDPVRTLPNSPYWDTKLETFKVMLNDAIEVVNLQRAGDSSPGFTMDLGVSSPMLYLLKRCRDPTIRRRGIALLKYANCQEGIWNSNLIAKVGEIVIAIEERGVSDARTSDDIPFTSRIGLTKTEILPAQTKTANVRHRIGETWLQHPISWE